MGTVCCTKAFLPGRNARQAVDSTNPAVMDKLFVCEVGGCFVLHRAPWVVHYHDAQYIFTAPHEEELWLRLVEKYLACQLGLLSSYPRC